MARPLAAPATVRAPRPAIRGATLPWLILLTLAVLLFIAGEAVPWAFKFPPAWVVPLKGWINELMVWLRDVATFGPFTFQELTRAISWLSSSRSASPRVCCPRASPWAPAQMRSSSGRPFPGMR